MTYRTDHWMALCVGRRCVNCEKDDGTVVAAHANQQRLGKGMGIKAASFTCVPLCSRCHFWLDNIASREDAQRAWASWHHTHLVALCQAELIAPIDYSPRVRPFRRDPNSKVLPRPGEEPPRAA